MVAFRANRLVCCAMPWIRSVIGRICSTEAASFASSALALSDCSAVSLVSLKTSFVRSANSSIVRDSSLAACATVSTFSRVDDRLHRGAGFRQGVLGHFGHGFGVVAHCRDRFDELSGDLLDRSLELCRERCHFLAPFLRPLLLGFAARTLHFLNLENVAPENLDGLDH